MSAPFALRRARADEAEAVAALQRRSREAAMPFMRGLHTPAEDLAFFRQRVFPACEVWVAEHAGALVGMIAFRAGWIDHLYVEPGRQRNGIGGALLALAKQRHPALELWVFQSNPNAIGFYEANGFRRIRTTAGDNEERQPDALYAWSR